MLKVITSPGQEPITIAEAKKHLRIATGDTDDDTYITTLITVAREEVEQRTQRQIMPVTVEDQREGFAEIRLPRPPFQVIDSVKYDNGSNVETTWGTSNYWIDETAEPAKFCRADGATFPEPKIGKPNNVRIRYSCGYGLQFTAATNDTCTATSNNYNDGQRVRLFSAGTLPDPLAVGTDYYIISTSGSTFELSTTFGGAAVDIIDTGTGVHWVTHIPEQLKQAILVILTDYYQEARASTVTGHIVTPIEGILERLTNPYRVFASP